MDFDTKYGISYKIKDFAKDDEFLKKAREDTEKDKPKEDRQEEEEEEEK